MQTEFEHSLMMPPQRSNGSPGYACDDVGVEGILYSIQVDAGEDWIQRASVSVGRAGVGPAKN
jgi:hypothetical protein